MPRESQEARRRRAIVVCERLADAYPKSRCALHYDTPFQLLVATVLSAQTTDLAVNRVTPQLFDRYPTPAAMAKAPEGDIEALIGSIGLWRNKARFLRGLSEQLVAEFRGELPDNVSDLQRLPGVARKTATAVLGTAMGIHAGLTVDTHMLRINRLLGLSRATDATKMARELESLIPKKYWRTYTHRIIDHGRLICVARRPRCGICPLADICPSARNAAAGYRPQNDEAVPASAKGLSWLS